MRLAPSTALLLQGTAKAADLAKTLRDKVGLWLVAAPRTDLAGKLWDAHAPLHGFAAAAETLRPWLALCPEAPMLLDVPYATPDEEYLDAVVLERVASATTAAKSASGL